MKPSATGRMRVRKILILVGIIFLAIFVSLQGLLTTLIGPLATPFVRVGTWVSQKVFWWNESRAITAEELADLHDDLLQLAIDAQAFQQLKEENEELKQQLDFVERTGVPSLSAQILAKSISRSVNRFVIDVGFDQGVQVGSAVVSGEGVLVGKVVELGAHSATVSALTDPSHSVAVSLFNESRTIGVATGSVSDLLLIDFIPTDELVLENDLVVTSGLDPFIPSGLLVGIVNTVQQQTGSPFQQAVVEPFSDIRRLSTVLVLISSPIVP